MHGNAKQLVGYFHGNLVVRNENELHIFRHAGHQLAEPAYIGVIQGRINLVEYAEWRRIQFKNRKYQGNCR